MAETIELESTFAYAGIGARKTPTDICNLMTLAAESLTQEGMVLRSGGAFGADKAFESGSAVMRKEIFIPYEGFLGRKSEELGVISPKQVKLEDYELAKYLASEHHPAWRKLTPAIQQIMIRNSFQILGQNMRRPVLFIMCWTPDGKGGGGTGQAIRIAKSFDIPVFDLGGIPLEEIGEGINDIIGPLSEAERNKMLIPF